MSKFFIRVADTDQFLADHQPNGNPFGGGAYKAEFPTLDAAAERAREVADALRRDLEIVQLGGWNPYVIVKTIHWNAADRTAPRVDDTASKALADLKEFVWSGDGIPSYYKFFCRGVALTPFDLIEALKLNFNLGCAIKYVTRAGKKTDALSDLRKARNCLDREIKRLETETPVPFGAATASFRRTSGCSVAF